MKQIKAVIFDLDGVIVKTDELHYMAWKYLCDKEGIEFNRHINHRLRGVSRMESLEIILEKSTKSYLEHEKNQLATIKNNKYVELLTTLTKNDILPGVTELLFNLRNKGIKIAIGSSSKNTPLILKQVQLQDVFDAVADGNDITFSKPNPEVFLVAAQKLGIKPMYCMVVEDAEAGVIAANSAEMFSVAVSDAKTCGLANLNLDDIRDLINYIKS